MKIACCVWALSLPELELLRAVSELGFREIDIQPGHLRTLESRLLAQELGLNVSCVGASFGMPEGASLDHVDELKRRAAVEHVINAIDSAACVGASVAYVVPGKDGGNEALERYADSMLAVADCAQARDVKVAIEHFPGTALATAGETLEFIQRTSHPNLYLLVDTGHLQMSGEDAETVIENAGERLAYVHFDDNDGTSDLHWSLLDGVMTAESLSQTLRALQRIGYDGALSLELSPALDKPEKSLSASRDILLSALQRLS